MDTNTAAAADAAIAAASAAAVSSADAVIAAVASVTAAAEDLSSLGVEEEQQEGVQGESRCRQRVLNVPLYHPCLRMLLPFVTALVAVACRSCIVSTFLRWCRPSAEVGAMPAWSLTHLHLPFVFFLFLWPLPMLLASHWPLSMGLISYWWAPRHTDLPY